MYLDLNDNIVFIGILIFICIIMLLVISITFYFDNKKIENQIFQSKNLKKELKKNENENENEKYY